MPFGQQAMAYTEMEKKSSGWLPWSSLGKLKLAFSVSSEDQGSQPDFSISVYMGQVTELWLSCYLVLLSIDSKTR